MLVLLAAVATIQVPVPPTTSARLEVRYVGPALNQQPHLAGRWSELELDTADGPETFGLYEPSQPPIGPRPLLVHFHAFGGGHPEVGFFTEFMDEAEKRGWYLVCPDQDVSGLSRRTYGSPAAQARVEAVLRWVVRSLPVDRDRVYAYGFSMGGGDALSYAAQHLDPTGVMFAAIAQNAGTLSLTEEYASNASSRLPLQAAFGATPTTDPYTYLRSSCLDYGTGFDPFGDTAALNLTDLPVRSWFAALDRPYIQLFGDDLDLILADHDTRVITGANHSWDAFDYPAVCDWFEAQTRTIPLQGRLRVTRDARYFDLSIERLDSNAFGRIGHFDLTQPHDLRFSRLENIASIRVDAAVTGVPLTFRAQLPPDGQVTRTLFVDGHTSLPTRVVLDGADVTLLHGVLWDWDAAGNVLELRTPASSTLQGGDWLVVQ